MFTDLKARRRAVCIQFLVQQEASEECEGRTQVKFRFSHSSKHFIACFGTEFHLKKKKGKVKKERKKEKKVT